MQKLKRVVIKEELVALTGDFVKAVLLNQFLYWSERVKDFDKFIEEERQRQLTGGGYLNIEKCNGWIYKTAEELSQETMLGLTPKTIRTHIKALISNGWIDERENPKYKWDKTKQYRVNIVKLQRDLEALGYALDTYPLLSEAKLEASRKREIPVRESEFTNQKREITIQEGKKEKALPEITTENITETTAEINTYALNSARDSTQSSPNDHDQQEKPRKPFRTIKQQQRFDAFWEAYPRKRSKGQAEKTWTKLNPDDDLLEEILTGLENAKRSVEWQRDEGQFIPYPSTWLNAQGWEDEYEEARSNGKTGGGFGKDGKQSAGGKKKDPLAGFRRAEELDFYKPK